jgi:hypothetical protein
MPCDKTAIRHLIESNAVYSLESARAALGLARATLRREIRLGRLRVSKRAGRYYILGCWLLQWLQAGEIVHDRQSPRESSENLMALAAK